MTTLCNLWRRWLAVCLVVLCAAETAGGDFLSLQRRIVEIHEENRAAMVRVKAVYEAMEDEDTPQVFIGSGFFISREGYVVTNTNIVQNPMRGAKPIRVWAEHEGVSYSADVVGVDPVANIGLLRLNTLPRNFRFLSLVDTPDMPPVGTLLVRLSMPLEFDATPELGMITGYESRFGGRLFPCKYLRTSVAGSPGDGGSAYLDLNGRLLGVNVVSVPEVGATYIIPARAVLRIREDLLSAGEVTRGWIGFEVREESSVSDGSRIVLAAITDRPAREAGLLPGDVLRQIGEYPIRTLDDLRNAMFYTRVGQYVQVRVTRDGSEREVNVRIAARPDDEPLEIVRPLPSEDLLQPISPVRTSEATEDDLEEDGDDLPRLVPHQ